MKSDLQIQAETLARDFKQKGRKPVVIEFAGTPKAGKTTTLSAVQAFLKRCGFKVEVVVERASICPIRDKKHSNFNIWTASTTLAQILEKTQTPPRADDPEILILDRGLFDAIAWLAMMERLARIRREERETTERFLLLPDWRKRIAGVVVMTASPSDAMKREQGDLPVEGEGGSIMNEPVLEQFKANTIEACKRLEGQFRIFQVDTSQPGSDKKKTAEKVARIVLDLINEQLGEEILCLERRFIEGLFGGKTTVTGSKAAEIVEFFVSKGKYVRRAEAEGSKELVQALPIAIIRTKSGQVLLLRRREKQTENPLHNRVVIWAGGHVRKEDANNGHSVVQGAVRELHEELRLSIEPKALRLVGAIFADLGGSTSKHVAIVYEWRAETDDVAVALSNSEFFERRGTSLSGKFLAVADLAASLKGDAGQPEPWSEQILRNFLSEGSSKFGELSLL
jgi:predicted NUDIX family phosphoesterase/predicted ATPase